MAEGRKTQNERTRGTAMYRSGLSSDELQRQHGYQYRQESRSLAPRAVSAVLATNVMPGSSVLPLSYNHASGISGTSSSSSSTTTTVSPYHYLTSYNLPAAPSAAPTPSPSPSACVGSSSTASPSSTPVVSYSLVADEQLVDDCLLDESISAPTAPPPPGQPKVASGEAEGSAGEEEGQLPREDDDRTGAVPESPPHVYPPPTPPPPPPEPPATHAPRTEDSPTQPREEDNGGEEVAAKRGRQQHPAHEGCVPLWDMLQHVLGVSRSLPAARGFWSRHERLHFYAHVCDHHPHAPHIFVEDVTAMLKDMSSIRSCNGTAARESLESGGWEESLTTALTVRGIDLRHCGRGCAAHPYVMEALSPTRSAPTTTTTPAAAAAATEGSGDDGERRLVICEDDSESSDHDDDAKDAGYAERRPRPTRPSRQRQKKKEGEHAQKKAPLPPAPPWKAPSPNALPRLAKRKGGPALRSSSRPNLRPKGAQIHRPPTSAPPPTSPPASRNRKKPRTSSSPKARSDDPPRKDAVREEKEKGVEELEPSDDDEAEEDEEEEDDALDRASSSLLLARQTMATKQRETELANSIAQELAGLADVVSVFPVLASHESMRLLAESVRSVRRQAMDVVRRELESALADVDAMGGVNLQAMVRREGGTHDAVGRSSAENTARLSRRLMDVGGLTSLMRRLESNPNQHHHKPE